MRKLLLLGRVPVLAFMVLAIFACGSGSGFKPESLDPESLDVVEIGSGQPIEVRALLSALVVPDVSSPIQTAIEIAIEDFGPIHGHQVSVEILDEMCSGEGGRAAAEAVVADAQVVGVIGTMCSGAAVEASPILSAAGLSMISPYNTSPVLTSDLAGNAGQDHHKGYYRVSDNDLIEAGVVAQFSYDELGLRTMVAVHDGDPYTSVIANAFAVAFREHGGAVPVVARVEKGQADMAAVIAQFDEADPDGVFIPLFPMEVRSLIQQAARLGALDGVTMIVAAAAFTTEILALPESEGFYFSAPDPGDSGNTNQTTGKSAADVLAAFEVAFGGPPTSPYWAHGYDATTLLLSAIEQASVVDGETLSIDRAALRDALDSTADFRGILGTLTCDDYGDCGTGRSVIHLHEDSGVTDPSLLPVVYPESLGVVEIGSGQPIEVRALLAAFFTPLLSSPLQTAIEIAIEDFGPIHGHQVSVETLDEMCSGEGGRAAAEAVVADAQVVGVIGTRCSGAAVEAMPILSAAGLSMISPSNTSPVLTSDLAGNAGQDHHKGYYRVSDNDLIEAGLVAQFSYDELELRTMVTVHDGDPYTSALANAFAVAFREHGGAVLVVARVEKGQADMAAVIAQFYEADPDGVFIPLFATEARSLIQQAARLGALDGVTMIVGAAALATEILALPESEGLYFAAPEPRDSGNTNQTTGKSAADVLAAFEVAFGGPSSYPYWAHGYDATTLLLSAIEQASVVDGETLSIDRAALRDTLDSTADFRGILGTLTCDDYGDCGPGRSVIHLHEDSGVTDSSLLPVVYTGARDTRLPQQ